MSSPPCDDLCLTRPQGAGIEAAPAIHEIARHEFAPMSWFQLTLTLAGRAVINPPLAIDLLRAAWRFRHRHWYKRFPFLPLPAETYLRWRMYTAYGDENAVPPADDVVAFARWLGTQP